VKYFYENAAVYAKDTHPEAMSSKKRVCQ